MNVTVQASERLEVNVMRISDIDSIVVTQKEKETSQHTTWRRIFIGNIEIILFEGDNIA